MQHHGAPTRLIDSRGRLMWLHFSPGANACRCVRVGHDPARIDSSRAPHPTRMDPRAKATSAPPPQRYFLKGNHHLIWMGEPHTMNRRLIAQSGTFAVPGAFWMSR